MIRVRHGKSTLEYIKSRFGYIVLKRRRNADGTFAKAERSYIVNAADSGDENIHVLRVKAQLGILEE